MMLSPQNKQAAINSNISHFCWPGKFAQSHIKRINPDKNTFLTSNLLVSNILNHLPPTRTPDPPADDAYVSKDIEMERSREIQAEKKEKLQRVRNQAKARTQSAKQDREAEERQMLKQVICEIIKIEQIQLMRIEMNEKARDVMSRKEDTAYLGRNLFLQGDKFLKNMREANPNERTLKTEATRMLMKECAKQKGRNPPQPDPSFSEDHSESIPASSAANYSTANASMQASVETHQREGKPQTGKEELLVKLIKNKSFDNVLKEQKRHAAWRGFTDNWAMGFYKNEDVITTKKKRRNKRSPRKFINASESSTNNLLDYNDLFTRHASLKKYRECFNTTASSYALLSP